MGNRTLVYTTNIFLWVLILLVGSCNNSDSQQHAYNEDLQPILSVSPDKPETELEINDSASSFTLCSWNIRDFGKSRSNEEIDFIANTVKNHDIVALQEVVAGYGGAQAVARLNDALNRKGAKWDYVVSDPTFSSSYKTERYAFLWKPSKVKAIGRGRLEQNLRTEIDREPFMLTFSKNRKEFTLVNFHAVSASRNPEIEVKYFEQLPGLYPNETLIFCGDFNISEEHEVFTPLKNLGFTPAVQDQKTTIGPTRNIDSDCLVSEFDNVFYPTSKFSLQSSKALHFYRSFATAKEACLISDHIPLQVQLQFK